MSGSLRGHGATVLVTALATVFGVGLLGVTEVIAQATSESVGDDPSVRLMLTIVSFVFTAIAIYVAAVVTTNTVATIVAGRLRTIALVRLLGATAAGERRRLAREGLLAGAAGAAIGMVAAWALVLALVLVGIATGALPDRAYSFITVTMAVPVGAVVLATWLAAWSGSRRVLAVTPVAALGAAVPEGEQPVRARRGRAVVAAILFALGLALLALGIAVGMVSPAGMLIAVIGGIASFTGVIAGSVFVIPQLLRLAGLLLGRDAAAVLGARNALRHPERSSRSAIALVIGVTLVTMFAVAGETFRHTVLQMVTDRWGDAGLQQFDQTLTTMTMILSFLVGFSAVIAAVGLVNALTVGVLQRTREFGLLRALGFSTGQLRRTIAVEAVQLTATAFVLGTALGIGYGWAGAQSLIGSEAGHGRLIPPVVPWWFLAGVAAVAALLALSGSLLPARHATRVSPVQALAVE